MLNAQFLLEVGAGVRVSRSKDQMALIVLSHTFIERTRTTAVAAPRSTQRENHGLLVFQNDFIVILFINIENLGHFRLPKVNLKS